ncbi:MAG: hypothetical protein ACK4MQ_04160 [Hyphomonas sp.]
MLLPRVLPALLILTAAACGRADDAPAASGVLPAADAPAADSLPDAATPAAAAAGFDWDKWAEVVNSDACGWLPADFMASIGVEGSSETERSSSGSRCLWKSADGSILFSAGIQAFDSAVNLAGDRREAIRLAGEMPAFSFIGNLGGTVTAIYRSDRGRLSMYPNSDDESILIVINAHHTMQDTAEEKQAKNDRVRAYTHRLIDTYGL